MDDSLLDEIRQLVRTGQYAEAFRRREELKPYAERPGPARGLYHVIGNIERMETGRAQVEIADATLAPLEGVTENAIVGGGVFDAGMALCEASMLRRVWGFRQARGKRQAPPGPIHAGEFLYGGLLVMQYGHFILETLARAWAFELDDNRSKPIVFQNLGPARRFDELPPFARDIFDFLRIDRARIVIDNDGGRFERIGVPMPGYIAQTYFSARHCAFLSSQGGESGRLRVERYRERYEGRSIYLSRAGVAGSPEEAAFQDALGTLGVTAVLPELLPFEEQLAIFAHARRVIGIMGSAFHTLVFLPRIGATLAMIARRQRPNENFHTIDRRIAAAQPDYRCQVIRAFDADGNVDFAAIRGRLAEWLKS